LCEDLRIRHRQAEHCVRAADPTIETAEIRFDPGGDVMVVTGTISRGQGHAPLSEQAK